MNDLEPPPPQPPPGAAPGHCHLDTGKAVSLPAPGAAPAPVKTPAIDPSRSEAWRRATPSPAHTRRRARSASSSFSPGLVVDDEETELRLLAQDLPQHRYRIEVLPCFRKPGMPEQSHDQLRALGVTSTPPPMI